MSAESRIGLRWGMIILIELLAKITFLQEAPKMEIAKLLWYKE